MIISWDYIHLCEKFEQRLLRNRISITRSLCTLWFVLVSPRYLNSTSARYFYSQWAMPSDSPFYVIEGYRVNVTRTENQSNGPYHFVKLFVFSYICIYAYKNPCSFSNEFLFNTDESISTTILCLNQCLLLSF